MIPRKATLTALTLGILLLALKAFDWRDVLLVADFKPRRIELAPTEDQLKDLRFVPARGRRQTPTTIIDPSGSMDAFYQALEATEQRRPGAITRIVHYGESPTTADLITADIRTLLQQRFGDAGSGFSLVAKPWAWYQHRGVEIRGASWRIHPAHQGQLRDGLFGLGGVTFLGGPGASSRIQVKDNHNTFVEVSYLQQPDGGTFTLYGDSSPIGIVETRGEQVEGGFASYSIPPGISEFSIGNITGQVRLFGIRLGKDQPGVMYDSLGLNGASIVVPSRQFNEAHWAQQLQHAKPQLVVLNYGINESVYAAFVNSTMEKEIRRVIERVHKAAPNAAILLMAPMDRGDRDAKGEIVTAPALARVVEIQERVAAETNCAFFNTFAAMGGSGTMAKWYLETPRLVSADLMHPLPAGAKKVGELFFKGLMDGFVQYKVQQLSKRATGPKS